jgi:hypothetical protein
VPPSVKHDVAGVVRGGITEALADGAHVKERELPGQRDDVAPVPARGRVWAAQREQPLGLRELPEVELRAAKSGFQAARIGHFRDLLILRELNGVQRERRGVVLDLEGAFVHPHGDLFSGQTILSKEPPVLEFDIAMSVKMTGKLRRIQHP